MGKFKLAEALLRRKELQEKVELLKKIKDKDLFEMKAVRKSISESIDDIVLTIPKMTASQFTAEYDFYARQLRLADAVIQRANWDTEVDLPDTVMGEFPQK